jgi:hypothetical protein
VFPCEALESKTPENSTESYELHGLPKNANVVYWASESTSSDSNDDSKEKIHKNPWDAYKKYENSGVVRTNSEGSVTIYFHKPSEYYVPSGKKLTQHVHYRYCLQGGVLSPVKTIFL